ncbi:hypothetical protein [Ferrimonas balearica]|uniref:hypothetical protein n=1 Tax=Ferrimonas balearica TaxID=44012 RepID=UPI001C998172|nr:hypothetical protein [Ferrimonas balearica]MBY5993682.1 hypothetical protein [Ferrimonas balearica]
MKIWFTPETFYDSFVSAFKKGEVFLYTSAYLSAFFVFYVKDSTKPPGLILSLVFFSGLGGALIYTFSYSAKVLNLNSYAPENALLIVEMLIVFSVIVIWYWSTLPSNANPNTGSKASQKQQVDLENNFNSLKDTGL